MPEYVPTGVAAKALGWHRKTLARWVHDGDLEPHAVTVGGHYRWDMERLLRDVAEARKRRDRRLGR